MSSRAILAVAPPCPICGKPDTAMFLGECAHDLMCPGCWYWAHNYIVALIIAIADRAAQAKSPDTPVDVTVSDARQ